MQNARETLKSAQSKIAQLVKDVEGLEESLARAAAMAEEAQASLDAFADLDQMIAKSRADAVKAGRDPRTLPPGLTAKVAARIAALAELEQAKATRELLSSELQSSKAALGRSQAQLADLAAAVLREMADEMAQELGRCEQRAWELRQTLTACGAARLYLEGLGWLQIGLHAATAAIVRGYDPGQFALNLDPGADLSAAWIQRLKVLMNDPNAEIDAPAAIHPEDYRHDAAGRAIPPNR